MKQVVRQWVWLVFLGLFLLSAGASASQQDKYELYVDGSTWNIPKKESPTNYVAAVYIENKQTFDDSFSLIYIGQDGIPPLGWRIAISTTEIANTPTGALINVTVRLGPYLYQDYVAEIEHGNADITAKHNSKESIDWLVERLTRTEEEYRKTIDTKEEVGYVEVSIEAVEQRLRLVGTSTGDQLVKAGNVETKRYTFGTRNAREAILKAKENWDYPQPWK